MSGLIFSHPWCDELYLNNVPNNKWDEFYSIYGYYRYFNESKDKLWSAYNWMLNYANQSNPSDQSNPPNSSS